MAEDRNRNGRAATAPSPHLRGLINALVETSRISARQDVDRQLDLSQVERRVISLIGRRGESNFTDLVRLTGIQQAQISRSLRDLEQAGLLDRLSTRGQVGLSASGEKINAQILEISQWRNARITRGLDGEACKFFSDTSVALIGVAAALLDSELSASSKSDENRPASIPRSMPNSELLVPPLTTLSVYLNRTATLATKRIGAISSFEAELLSRIGQFDPLAQAQLTRMQQASKSQVARALAKMEEQQLIARQKIEGRRDILIMLSATGQGLCAQLEGLETSIDEQLLGVIPEADRGLYLAILALLTENARQLSTGAGASQSTDSHLPN